MDEPKRAKLRKYNELPIEAKPSTESEDPRRVTPNTANAEANRAKLRKDKELPTCTKSKTDKDAPIRVKP
jgi:hypothetical protein